MVADAEPDCREDPEGAAVLAGVLQGLDGPQADLHGLELLLDHEGVGLHGALSAGAPQEVLQPAQHLSACATDR